MDTTRMNAHVTRAEFHAEVGKLRAEIAQLPTREELARHPTREELREELAKYATRADLDVGIGALFELIKSSALDTQKQVQKQLSRELAQHLKAMQEENRSLIRSLDDKYKDLPGRVAALEADR